LRLKSAEK